jgi:hypothetical protein
MTRVQEVDSKHASIGLNVPPAGLGVERPDTHERLQAEIERRRSRCERLGRKHSGAQKIWGALAGPIAWLAAVLAALSGLSVIAANATAATVLTIGTTLIATTNAAVKPEEASRRHQKASQAFLQLEKDAVSLDLFELDSYGRMRRSKDLAAVREELARFDKEVTSTVNESPAIGVVGWVGSRLLS